MWNDQVNGEKGKLPDTSLPFDARPYPYKPLESGNPSKQTKRNDERQKTQAAQSPLERLLDMTVPERAKTITPLLNAATFEADRQAKKSASCRRPVARSGPARSGDSAASVVGAGSEVPPERRPPRLGRLAVWGQIDRPKRASARLYQILKRPTTPHVILALHPA